ncbi:3-oxoacyl-[acyl-carrier-protein] reductase FabG [Baekduia alba]|uniref:SDR family oxidoreductase n=1 Tax=Baekduia alba TaxID=2997333 RepID=UPI002341EA73|nr:SDR family oxidoreductase [Baekduia alba]WCB96181.1 3-oxoacyl-[acyl-carrier-protein] reductase FabG [Baekduia alba]
MDLGLDGRVALVTGGSRGIGRGIAEALAAEGAKVAVTSRSADAGAAVAGTLPGAKAYVFDSDDLGAVDGLVAAVERDLGPVDIYVANTGGPPVGADPLGFSDAQWEAAHRTLVVSPMAILRRVLPGMRERGWGRVLAVSSGAAVEPIAGLQLSNANRPGLLNAFKHLAHQTAGDGVTFNAVLPGRIATDRIADNAGGMAAAQAAARTEVPAGRLGDVAELAAAAAFLVSAPASYVTGQSLRVDGGVTRSW